jgi:hypothetical protein
VTKPFGRIRQREIHKGTIPAAVPGATRRKARDPNSAAARFTRSSGQPVRVPIEAGGIRNVAALIAGRP